jgi:hypothetical protein
MILIRDFDPTLTQTFTIKTDVEKDFGLLCAYNTALLTPSAYPYVSLNGSVITVDPTLTAQSDAGLHTVSISVSSSLYPGTVTA